MDKWAQNQVTRLVNGLYSWRYLWLAVALIATVAAYPVSRRLAFDQSIESLFSVDDPQLNEFLYSKSTFGGDEFAVVAWSMPDLFDENDDLSEAARQNIIDFVDELNQIKGVRPKATWHLAQTLRFRFRRARVRELVRNVLVGDDNQTTAIVLRLEPVDDAPVPRGETIAEIRRAAREHSPRAYVVGEPIQIADMFRIVQQDGSVLFGASLVILGTVIFVLFRNLRWVVLPLVAVTATILWTEALLVLADLRLSMVSSMLNSMVTIIVIATITHVTVHYREHRRGGQDPSLPATDLGPAEAMRRTLTELAAPVFWTCATTATGFLALLASDITPVRSFGLMMGLAALIAFVVFAMVLPGGILLGRGRSIPRAAPLENQLSQGLTLVAAAIERRPRSLLLFGAVLMAVTLPGLFRLELETDFSRNFRDSSDTVQSLRFVETHLGGAGTWEVNFPAPAVADLDDAFQDRVRDFADQLRQVRDARGEMALNVKAITDGLDLIPRIKVPFFRNLKLIEERLELLETLQPGFVPSLYNPEEGRMRIILRSREQQRSETKLGVIRTVQQLADDEFGADAEVRPPSATGMFVLLTFVIQSLLSDQLVSFAWAAAGISLMMTFAFRSLTLGVLSLVPNIFPIVLVIGTMGLLGTPVNIGTAMIASVSMGLTVDSTIHYVTAFRRAVPTLGVDGALRATHQGVGRALVFAHIALVAGFLVLTLSDFIPLVYFGVLLSLSMLGGLAGSLVMLPILLRWTCRTKPQAPETGQEAG